MRDRIAAWPIATPYAALFGSAAERQMRVGSDIDIFIVRPKRTAADEWAEQLEALRRDVATWTGNDARIFEYGVDSGALRQVTHVGGTTSDPAHSAGVFTVFVSDTDLLGNGSVGPQLYLVNLFALAPSSSVP